MRIASVCSAHGFGHVTRQHALAGSLLAAGHDVTVFSAAPPALYVAAPEGCHHRHWVVDVGIAQRDSLTADIPQTLTRLQQHCSTSAIDDLAAALREFDRVVVDVAPMGLEAARRAGVPAVAVGNFSWPWIYEHIPDLQSWVTPLRNWQHAHPAISLWPGPGLSATEFSDVVFGGVLGREAEPFPLPEGSILVSLGGFAVADVDRLLPQLAGITWVLAPPMENPNRPDCLYLPGVPYPSLVAGAQMVLTKPGYGIFVEAALGQTRILWLPRTWFPESPHVVAAMAERGDVCVGSTPSSPDFSTRLHMAIAKGRQTPPPPPIHNNTHAIAKRLERHLSEPLC